MCAGFIQSPHTLATEALDILLVDETQNKMADSRQSRAGRLVFLRPACEALDCASQRRLSGALCSLIKRVP